MTLNLFAPPTTNWTVEAPRRMAETRGMYEAAIRDTRGDALGAARSMAGTGSGAAASRTALQAVAPAVADLRRQQILASQAMGNRLRAEQLAERERSSDFMNNLFGGISGIAGQMMVPLISAFGMGGSPSVNGMPSGVAPPGGPPSPFAAGMAPGLPDNSTVPETFGSGMGGGSWPLDASGRMPGEVGDTGLRLPSSGAPAASSPAPAPPTGGPVSMIDPFAEDERRRRGGSLGSLFGTAAPMVGMANPLAGAGLGVAGRLFG